MLHFKTFNANHGATILLSTLFVAGCSYNPPSVDPGSGGGGAGGNASSSSSAGGSAEMCVNDKDDDSNGQIDCADSACSSTHKCVPSSPADAKWSTPFYAKYMAFDAQEPPCATQEPPTVYGINPSSDECTGCACEISGTKCVDAELTCYDSLNCSDGIKPSLPITGTTCTAISGLSLESCAVTKEATFDPGIGQCKVTSSSPVLASPEPFADKLLRCDAPTNKGAGCLNGQICALAPGDDYDLQCIAASGKQDCPADWATNYTGYQSWKDNRSCTPCTCEVSKASCAANDLVLYTHHTDTNCQSPTMGGTTAADCTTIKTITSIIYAQPTPIATADACNSTPSGSLDPGVQSTICCRSAIP